MSESSNIIIMAGAITAGNEVLFAPLAGSKAPALNWRLIPATAGAALLLNGLERIAPNFAVGLAWLSLATILIVPFGNAPTPLQNAEKLFGVKQS